MYHLVTSLFKIQKNEKWSLRWEIFSINLYFSIWETMVKNELKTCILCILYKTFISSNLIYSFKISDIYFFKVVSVDWFNINLYQTLVWWQKNIICLFYYWEWKIKKEEAFYEYKFMIILFKFYVEFFFILFSIVWKFSTMLH